MSPAEPAPGAIFERSIDKDDTTIVDGAGKKAGIEARIKQIKTQIELADPLRSQRVIGADQVARRVGHFRLGNPRITAI
jgi:hypothetical protein